MGNDRSINHIKMPKMTKSRIRTIFTLIELIVVIAIISILTSMLLPALQKAKETAMTITCAKQMKQIGLGFINYLNSNEGFFPLAYTSSPIWLAPVARELGIPTAPETNISWIPPKNSVFWCPKHLQEAYTPTVWFNSYAYGTRKIGSYPAIGGDQNGTAFGPARISKIKAPSKAMLIAEMYRPSNLFGSTLFAIATPKTYPFGRHGKNHNSPNFLYVDGHVNMYKNKGISFSEQWSTGDNGLNKDPFNLDWE